jgi:hypothetical protein
MATRPVKGLRTRLQHYLHPMHVECRLCDLVRLYDKYIWEKFLRKLLQERRK